MAEGSRDRGVTNERMIENNKQNENFGWEIAMTVS